LTVPVWLGYRCDIDRARGRKREDMQARTAKLGKMAVIVPAAFMNSMGIGTMSLGILFVVKDLYGAAPALVASLGAMWSLSYFTGCIVLRRVAARFKPRTSMIIMSVLSASILFAFLLKPGLWQAFVAFSVYGFFTAFFWPPLMGWLSQGHEGAELNKATSLFSLSWSVAGIFSPYVAGVLSERGKLLPVATAAGLFAFNALFLLASRAFIADDDGISPAASKNSIVEDRSTPLRYPAWLGAFLIYAVMGVVFNVFPVFARDELAQSESSIGLVLTFRATANAVGFFILGRVTILQFKRLAIPALSAATAVTLVALIFQRTALGFSVLFAVIGLLQSAIYNNSLFYATSGAPDRSKRASTHEALVTFGSVVGSISGGLLYQVFSMPVVFVGLTALLAAGAGAQSILVYRPVRRGSSARD